MTAYGTAIAIWERQTVRFTLEGISAPNARTSSMIKHFSDVFPSIAQGHSRGALFIQYDDYCRHPIASVAFGKQKSDISCIKLIPDSFFLDSDGYKELRNAAKAYALPAWEMKRDTVLWRGAATTRMHFSPGEPIDSLATIPRVALCLRLRDRKDVDAAICAPWGFQFDPEKTVQWLRQENIFNDPIRPVSQAGYKYLIDIDGVANAWGFFEKLILGSCILKVESDYSQWFYDKVAAWEHYVPIANDLSDLEERINWCRDNTAEAEAIAMRGQAFALSHDLSAARDVLIRSARSCFVSY